jgi:hypothetical protein
MTDVLVCVDDADEDLHLFFPADKIVLLSYGLLALEGLRFRNCYLTNRAIEEGSANLFQHLYFNARMTGGKVLHCTDYRESE